MSASPTDCCSLACHVQNIHIIPPSLHPRSRLADLQARRVAEIVYVPVYDPSGSHPYAPVAVLEAFCAADATDSMLVANLISFIGSLLTSVQVTPQGSAKCWPTRCAALACIAHLFASRLQWVSAMTHCT